MASKILAEGRERLRSSKREKQNYREQDFSDSVFIIEGTEDIILMYFLKIVTLDNSFNRVQRLGLD